MKALVTGAAGFIGSHLVDALLDTDAEVLGIDNFCTGKLDNLSKARGNSRFKLLNVDLRLPLDHRILNSFDVVFHLAADPEVRTGLDNPESQYENNIHATYNVLEAMRKSKVQRIFVASSSTVYGEPNDIPTSETYLPLEPISIYGCSKLACETMAFGYCQTFGIQTIILRPANVIGSRATHGVVLDFVRKLQRNPKKLEILGDGKQSKSYVSPEDVALAFLILDGKKTSLKPFEVFNIGNVDRTSVTRIADLVCEELLLQPSYEFTEGTDGGRAWKGDVRTVLLTIEKISALGWRPKYSSDECMRRAIREIVKESKMSAISEMPKHDS